MPEENTNAPEQTEEQTTNETNDTNTEEQNEPKFTQEDVNSAVEQRLSRERKKLQKEMKEQIEQERREAEEYARLSEKEKQEKDYERRQKELQEREQKLNNRELLGEIKDDLHDQKLPQSFAETLLPLNDSEQIKATIQSLKKEWDASVNEGIREGLRQETPTDTTGTGTTQGASNFQDVVAQNAEKFRKFN